MKLKKNQTDVDLGYDLKCRKDDISSPEYLMIERHQKYNLDLSHTPISELPDNLSVGGSLDLWNTRISELPNNLSVGGYLDLWNNPIYKLPDNLSVDGSLYLRNTPISKKYTEEQIRKMVKRIGGGIYL